MPSARQRATLCEVSGEGSHSPPRADSGAAPLLRILGPLLVAAAGAACLYWSWDYGPDSLIDFGRELYIPWRLASGDTLYRDLVYLNGPLSPYWNALLFQLFGVGLRTL